MSDLKMAVGVVVTAIILLSFLLAFFLATDRYARRSIGGKERTRDYCVMQCKAGGYTNSSCQADPWSWCFRDGTNP